MGIEVGFKIVIVRAPRTVKLSGTRYNYDVLLLYTKCVTAVYHSVLLMYTQCVTGVFHSVLLMYTQCVTGVQY